MPGGVGSLRDTALAGLVSAAEALSKHGIFLFFRHERHFRNPLVPEELESLASCEATEDPRVLRVATETLPSRLQDQDLERGIYSPVPIAHGLESGDALDRLLESFRYEMIHVDEDRVWWWQGRRVARRIESFFTEQIGWEPSIGRWYFEYRVNEDWWDKCYFEADTSPLVGRAVERRDDGLDVLLSSGGRDGLNLDTLRLDPRERLFCTTGSHGEVEFSDSVRFSLLRGVSEDCSTVDIDGRTCPLAWPDGEICTG